MSPDRQPGEVVVQLYTKANCPLCDQLQDDLTWLGREQALRIVAHDIDADDALFEQFRYLVPVVEIDGVLHYPPHDLMQLRRALIAAAQTGATTTT